MPDGLIELWEWVEGRVDRTRDHFVLWCDPAGVEDCAFVGRGGPGRFVVEFCGAAIVPGATRDAVERQITFYLVEKRERDPWRYAKYHCGTGANAYSTIHWGFVRGTGE